MKVTNVGRLLFVVDCHLNEEGAQNVKALLGDSTDNNRVLSVNQVLRYLNLSGYQSTAGRLNAVYLKVRSDIRAEFGSARTDAIDWNEFVEFVNNYANHRSLSQVLKNAA
jgi:hypothetical protein